MTKTKKGFTIIEVVLVLAIAGLIFLMVFIALPALQRSQRNTRRRSDMARILAAFTEYQSNTGRMPSTDTDLNNFIQKYVGAAKQTKDGTRTDSNTACDGDQFCDPDGSMYSLTRNSPFTTTSHFQNFGDTFNHEITYYSGARCDTENNRAVGTGGGVSDVAISYVLEGGAVYCGDNQ